MTDLVRVGIMATLDFQCSMQRWVFSDMFQPTDTKDWVNDPNIPGRCLKNMIQLIKLIQYNTEPTILALTNPFSSGINYVTCASITDTIGWTTNRRTPHNINKFVLTNTVLLLEHNGCGLFIARKK